MSRSADRCRRLPAPGVARPAAISILLLLTSGCGPVPTPIETVAQPGSGSPLVALRLLVAAGSAHDPPGKEGLAALTALVVGRGGSALRTHVEIAEALYPMATRIEVLSDRESTLFAVQVHRETLPELTELMTEMLLRPGFREEDLERHRQALLTHLTSTLRAGDDEQLGLEAIQGIVFAGHPYAHPAQGTVEGLGRVELADVKAFYRRHYTRANLILGVAGGYPEGYVDELKRRLGPLPAGPSSPALPQPTRRSGRHLTIIEKPTAGGVGIHLGFPIATKRTETDHYALLVAGSHLGEHRSFHGRLIQELRVKRGLNYGDYAYVEHWHDPPSTFHPTPNVSRRHAYFSIWLRPVEPRNAPFALRAAVNELERLVEVGMSDEEFELSRDFLIDYSKLWAQSASRRLGFHLDGIVHSTPPYRQAIEEQLRRLDRDRVNAAIRRHLRLHSFAAVLVAAEPVALAEALAADRASPVEYPNPVEDAVLAADAIIATLPLELDSVETVRSAELFERR